MTTRGEVLRLAILGQLQREPMHGYELRKRLNSQLGTFRTLSYGSLYPALRRLTEAGVIRELAPGEPPHALAGRRGRIVYEITEDGRRTLTEVLASAGSASWEDDAFDVRFSLFATTDARTRLRILEGRRTRMTERLELLRTATTEARERMDDYTAELARHGQRQLEREVEWLEDLIDTERGTAGPHDFRTPAPGTGPTARTPAPPPPAPPGPPDPKEQ